LSVFPQYFIAIYGRGGAVLLTFEIAAGTLVSGKYEFDWGIGIMENDSMRTFVCVSPDDASSAALSRYAERLRVFQGYKWVAPENMHVTLLFLGESEPSQVQRVDSNLERLGNLRPFRVTVSDVGAFPDLTRPRTIWLGVREGARDMEKLAAKVVQAAKGAGYPAAAQKFKAHLTLARARGDGQMPPELRKILDDAPKLSWTCASFTLMKSVLTPKGPIYAKIREYGF
jgi:2'-5' RNA ligase